MKLFTVDNATTVRPRIAVEKDPFLHVAVGERGPGCWLARIALGNKDFGPNTLFIDEADVLQTPKGSYILVEPLHHKERRQAIVLCKIPPIPNRTIHWTGATKKVWPCPANDMKNLGPSNLDELEAHCRHCGAPLVHNEHPEYTWSHPANQHVESWTQFPPSNIVVLAEGTMCLEEGHARTRYPARLMIMAENSAFRVKRSGRFPNGTAETFVYWDGQGLHLMNEHDVQVYKGRKIDLYHDYTAVRER